jgi:hypothetical protein
VVLGRGNFGWCCGRGIAEALSHGCACGSVMPSSCQQRMSPVRRIDLLLKLREQWRDITEGPFEPLCCSNISQQCHHGVWLPLQLLDRRSRLAQLYLQPASRVLMRAAVEEKMVSHLNSPVACGAHRGGCFPNSM